MVTHLASRDAVLPSKSSPPAVIIVQEFLEEEGKDPLCNLKRELSHRDHTSAV